MISFSEQYNRVGILNEALTAHLVHLEDYVITHGTAGLHGIINYLTEMGKVLKGQANKKLNISTKFDGAPAVICGINPENGQFFVASKSILNVNPKVNYTDLDIEANHGHAPGLVTKLKAALKYLPELGIRGIVQGDMMFGPGDVKRMTIKSEPSLVFQPNTIAYVVPELSDLGETIARAKMGIVFHTTYEGPNLKSLRMIYDMDISQFQQTPNVWFISNYVQDISGNALFTKEESLQYEIGLNQLISDFKGIPPLFLKELSKDEHMVVLWLSYINDIIKQNRLPNKSDAKGLLDWVHEKTAVSTAQYYESLIKKNMKTVQFMFEMFGRITELKMMLIKKLRTINMIGTFIKRGDDYEVTGPEGFVIADRIANHAVKLVDRLEFSLANFTIPKTW